jgi:hypothetical protein
LWIPRSPKARDLGHPRFMGAVRCVVRYLGWDKLRADAGIRD